MENKLNTSQKRTCVAKKPTSWVALASRLVEAVLSLHSALQRPHLEHWAPGVEDRFGLTRARPVKAIKGLESFSCERLKGLRLFSLENNQAGSLCVSVSDGRV